MVIASQSSLTWVTWFRPMTQKRGSWEKNPGFPCHVRLSANKLSNEPAPTPRGKNRNADKGEPSLTYLLI